MRPVLLLVLLIAACSVHAESKTADLLDLNAQISESHRTAREWRREDGLPKNEKPELKLNAMGPANEYPCDPSRSECMRQHEHAYEDSMLHLLTSGR